MTWVQMWMISPYFPCRSWALADIAARWVSSGELTWASTPFILHTDVWTIKTWPGACSASSHLIVDFLKPCVRLEMGISLEATRLLISWCALVTLKITKVTWHAKGIMVANGLVRKENKHCDASAAIAAEFWPGQPARVTDARTALATVHGERSLARSPSPFLLFSGWWSMTGVEELHLEPSVWDTGTSLQRLNIDVFLKMVRAVMQLDCGNSGWTTKVGVVLDLRLVRVSSMPCYLAVASWTQGCR